MSDLGPFRERLDLLDDEVVRLLGARFAVCREIALFKREHDIPMMQPDRVEQVRARYLSRGAASQLPAEFTAALFELLIGATCRMEDELIDGATGSHDRVRGGSRDGVGEGTRLPAGAGEGADDAYGAGFAPEGEAS